MTDLTREGLVELAARVEQASGPDRELDAAVWLRLPDQVGLLWKHDGDVTAHARQIAGCEFVPAYTASLDAAMTLVPERYHRDVILSISPMSVDMGGKDYKAAVGGSKNRSSARSFALAIAAAALRARAMEAGRG